MTKEEAIQAFEKRKANRPTRVSNEQLPAGSPMYYYCIDCGHLAATLPETHRERPPRMCAECVQLEALLTAKPA